MEFSKHFSTIDTHAGGEPMRIITSGMLQPGGRTMAEKRSNLAAHADSLRRIVMHEPRGHHGMCGCLVTPPVTPEADFGVLFMHNEGFNAMSGHGVIAVVTAMLETGQLVREEAEPRIVIDSPAGQIVAVARRDGTRVTSVSFTMAPSFVYAADVALDLPAVNLCVDIAFAGDFYAVVDSAVVGLSICRADLPALQGWGSDIKNAIEAQLSIQHPLDRDLHGIFGVIFSDAPDGPGADLRNVTVFAGRQVDRSPGGAGTCARMATLHRTGRLSIGETFVHESIIGSRFTGRLLSETTVGPYGAVQPEVTGDAFVTGFHQFVIDPSDPLAAGFLLK